MGGNKSNIISVKSIFISLSTNDLKAILEKSNIQITESIDNLSGLYIVPRDLLTSDNEETNNLFDPILEIRNESWFEAITEFGSKFPEGENLSTILNQIIEFRNEFKNYYSEIIRDIQYHDIIKQKLKHIIEINNDIKKELTILEVDDFLNNKELKYLKAIKEIINIEIAQLIYSLELCKASMERIKKALEEQHNLIGKTTILLEKLKEKLLKILKRTENKENAIKYIDSDSAKSTILNLADHKNFEDSQKNFKTYIEEIEKLISSESSFFENINITINNIKEAQNKLFKDGENKNNLKESNLDFLKKKYTMSSEYKIHQLTLENDLIKDFFSEMSEPEQSNDVEFF